jgi:hypothetical protein
MNFAALALAALPLALEAARPARAADGEVIGTRKRAG